MTTIRRVLAAVTGLVLVDGASAQSTASTIAEVTIVLVHGALIDGSSWRGVYDVLTKDG